MANEAFSDHSRPSSPGLTCMMEEYAEGVEGADFGLFDSLLMPSSPDSRRPASPVSPASPPSEEPSSGQPWDASSLGCITRGPSCVEEPQPEPQPSTSAAQAVARKRGRKPHPRLPDLQAKADELMEQFNRLSKENAFLRNKLKVLERVVPHRDEAVGQLTQLLSSTQASSRARPTQLNTQSWPNHGEPTSPGQLPAAADDNQPFRAGAAAEANYSAGHSNAHEVTSGAAAGCRLTAGARGPDEPVGNTNTRPPAAVVLCPGPDGDVAPLTPAAVEQLMQTSPEDFRALWKHICLQMGVLVSGAEVHGPGSSPHVRLERFLERALSYVDKIKVLAPTCFMHTMYTNLDTGEHERPNESFWITCARSLQLTPQQLAEVSWLSDVYSGTVAPVVQQRSELASQLTTSLAVSRAHPSCLCDAMAAIHSTDELAQRLERNVMKEHQAHWDMNDYLCLSVLTPFQVAKSLTVAYPYIPDGVAMMHAFNHIRTASGSPGQAPNAASASLQLTGNAVLASLKGLLACHVPAQAATAPVAGQMRPMAAAPAAAALATLLATLQAAQRPVAAAVPAVPQPWHLQSMLAGMQAAHMFGRAAA